MVFAAGVVGANRVPSETVRRVTAPMATRASKTALKIVARLILGICSNGLENLFGCGVMTCGGQSIIDGQPLRRAPQTGSLKGLTECLMIERSSVHRTGSSGSGSRRKISDARARVGLHNPVPGIAFPIVGTLDSPVNYLIN